MPHNDVTPADAALLREIADQSDAIALFRADPSKPTVRAARLRALAEVMERSEQWCSQCGLPHTVDTSLPSEIWNRIAQPHEMLCPLCIDERLVKAGIRAVAQFYYVGEALQSASCARHENPRGHPGYCQRCLCELPNHSTSCAAFQKLQRAVCVALGRVTEWAPPHVANQALGFGSLSTDAGDAWNALREAAEITVTRNDDGFLDFVQSVPQGAG